MRQKGGRLAFLGLALTVPVLAPQAVFSRYVQNPASQASGIAVTDQNGRVTLNFNLKGALRLPTDPRLDRRSYAEAYAAALASPCRTDLKGGSRLRLERLADPSLDAGRLLVQNGRAYCLTLWNIKR